MHAYDLAGWGSLLSAEVSAAAALTGLLFVAISINLSSIVANPILPSRAIDALCKLANVLLIASLGLAPGISARLFGWVALAIGLVAWFIPTYNQFMQLREATANWNWREHKDWILTRALITQIATVPFLVMAISIELGAGGGLYWLLPGVLFSFIGGMFGAWILLVEILR
jgi:modulator of FtsH protease